MEDKLGWAQFIQNTFLLADNSSEMVLDMPFLSFNNANIQFIEKKFTWKFYFTTKTLSTTKLVELINKKEFAKIVLNKESETLIVYVIALKALLAEMTI